MSRHAALIGALAASLLGAAAHGHNEVSCVGFCYDDGDAPQFAIQLRHLATGLITFEACDEAPLTGVGQWGGPCAMAVFTGSTAVGMLDGELRLSSECQEPVGTVTSTCFALKDLFISPTEASPPPTTVDVSLNLLASSANSCDFVAGPGEGGEMTIAYRFDGMQSGVSYGGGHVHVILGAGPSLVTTGTIQLPVNRPLRLALSAGISGAASFDAIVTCIADWSVWLPDNGPVMNLPAGLTLTSAQGSIVDNQWVPFQLCLEDLDGSGAVGVGDLLQLLAAWGQCGGCAEDLDADGSVGTSDLLALLAAWGGC